MSENMGQLGLHLANAGYYQSADVVLSMAAPEAQNLTNRANVLRRLCRYAEAETIVRRALELHPGAQDATALLGCLRLDQGDAEGACELLKATVHLSGYYRFCYSLALFHAGRFGEAFREYDGRLEANQMPLPMWNGESLEGKTLAITCEQGFGDSIMYARFLENLPFKHFLLAPPALVRLIPNAQNSNISFSADYTLPLMSLPARLGLTELPPWKPYLSAPVPFALPRAVDTKLTIGVVWSSKAGGALRKPEEIRHGQQKSIPLDLLLPLAAIPGVKLISLQVDEASNDIGRLGAGYLIENFAPRIMDFADLAGFMCSTAHGSGSSGIDLILTVDTAPAHLAGALGKPVIVMLNYAGSWQWQNGSVSPWYPYDDFQIVRQKSPGDWASVIPQVKELIERRIADGRPI